MDCDYKLPLATSGRQYSGGGRSFDQFDNGSFHLSWKILDGLGVVNAPAFLTLSLADYLGTDGSNAYAEYQNPFRSDRAGVIPSHLSIFAFIKIAPEKGSMAAGFIEAASICALSFCAREYNASVKLGSSHVDVLSTS